MGCLWSTNTHNPPPDHIPTDPAIYNPSRRIFTDTDRQSINQTGSDFDHNNETNDQFDSEQFRHLQNQTMTSQRGGRVSLDVSMKRTINDKNRQSQGLKTDYGPFGGFGDFKKVYEVKDIKSEYIIGGKIASGAQGSVHFSSNVKTDKMVAIKKVKKIFNDHNMNNALQKELDILQKINHPNIVKVEKILYDKKHFYIVMENIRGGSLMDRIKKHKLLKEEQTVKIIKDVIDAVYHMHEQNITHRDLKPDNILYETAEQDVIKVADFGFACYQEKDKKLEGCKGTLPYMAPELFTQKKYDEKVDIWAIGVTTYFMMSGQYPFSQQGDSDKQIISKIINQELTFPGEIWDGLNYQTRNFIASCLDKNPKERPSAKQLLEHDWIKNTQLKEIDPQLQQKILINMSQFALMNSFQSAMISILANLKAGSEEVEHLHNLFKQFDKDNNGYLCKDEIQEALQQQEDVQISDLDLQEVFKSADINKDQKIDYEEFISIAVDKQALLDEKNIDLIFDMIDQNKDKHLSIEELKSFFNANQNDEDEKWRKLISNVTSNAESHITQEEFRKSMLEASKDQLREHL